MKSTIRLMRESVLEPSGFESLRRLVQDELDAGTPADELLAALETVRLAVDLTSEEKVLDVMDLIVGWCSPSARLKRSPATDHATRLKADNT